MHTHLHMHMLILQGMGEFRASLISSATAYHPAPERERDTEREGRLGVGAKIGDEQRGSGRLETGRRGREN